MVKSSTKANVQVGGKVGILKIPRGFPPGVKEQNKQDLLRSLRINLIMSTSNAKDALTGEMYHVQIGSLDEKRLYTVVNWISPKGERNLSGEKLFFGPLDRKDLQKHRWCQYKKRLENLKSLEVNTRQTTPFKTQSKHTKKYTENVDFPEGDYYF